MLLRSIRWRLQVWYGVLFALLLGGFGFAEFQLERVRILRDTDAKLDELVDRMMKTLPAGEHAGRPPHPRLLPEEGEPNNMPPADRIAERVATALAGAEEQGYYYALWWRDGRIISASGNLPSDLIRPEPSANNSPAMRRTVGIRHESIRTTPPGELMLVGRFMETEYARLRQLAWRLSAMAGVVLLVGSAGGWWLATRALNPIHRISAAATRIAAGDLTQRIDPPGDGNELHQLTLILNATFARLETAFLQQGRFAADAAHELRTPISVLLAQTQTALSRERSAPEYRQAVEACKRAADRMRRLIDSLLQLARLEAGQENIRQHPFNLAELVRETIELVRPLADSRRIRLHANVPSMSGRGDPERLTQVLTNLLTNAVEYNIEDGEVRVTGAANNGVLTLAISDTGPGISDEALPHIFERFYRSDTARSGGAHTGLGLAIAKAIIEAHGGQLDASSEPGHGATFTITLPAAT